MAQLTDKEIIEGIKSDHIRDHDLAIKALYLDTVLTLKVKDLVNRYGRAKVDADDILQESILVVRESVRNGKFKGKSQIRTFLIGVCKNKILSGKRNADHFISTGDFTKHEQVDEETSSIIFEEQSESRNRRNKILKELILQTGQKCQEALNLYYFLQYNMNQVAEKRGLKNANQAKKAVARCRDKLKKLITNHPSLESYLKETL